MKINLSKAIEKLPKTCDWVGIRHYKEVSRLSSSRNGLMDRNAAETQNGLMVEVLHQGQLAYFGTSDLSEGGIQMAYEKALGLAIKASRLNLYPFTPAIRPKEKGEYRSPIQRDPSSLGPAELGERLRELSKALKDHSNIIEAQAWAMISQIEVQFASSNESQWQQNFDIISIDMSATAKSGSEIQKRSLGTIARQWGAEALDLAPLLKQASRIKQEAIELLSAQECPSETMDIILMPDQLYLQVHESIGHPLELDRILGDERNYAGWSFVSPEDFGRLRYGPPILNVTFDPTLKGEMASYLFDDNGVRAKKEFLIEKGLLKKAIGGIEAQMRSKIPGVSCARSTSWNRPPLDRMGNINIEPGESSLEDMIESTQRGLLLKTNRSWSIDDYRNKFQFGCEYGQLIENGKITETVKNPNYRGQTVPFWNNLTHVGNEKTFEILGSPYCGKAEPNQLIRVGHAIPACKFKEVEVFGGAK